METCIRSLELFSIDYDCSKNVLPYEGIVNYHGKIILQEKADSYLNVLLNNIEWKHDTAVIYGKQLITKRKVAWYGDTNFQYSYSNTTKSALSWTKELLELKHIVEQASEECFNSCLLNLYHNGDEGMAYHSDAEKDLKKDGPIASLSFGAERKFLFKHKRTKENVALRLEHGSLLIMKGNTQTNWLHRLPPTKVINTPRISLTFRIIDKKISN